MYEPGYTSSTRSREAYDVMSSPEELLLYDSLGVSASEEGDERTHEPVRGAPAIVPGASSSKRRAVEVSTTPAHPQREPTPPPTAAAGPAGAIEVEEPRYNLRRTPARERHAELERQRRESEMTKSAAKLGHTTPKRGRVTRRATYAVEEHEPVEEAEEETHRRQRRRTAGPQEAEHDTQSPSTSRSASSASRKGRRAGRGSDCH